MPLDNSTCAARLYERLIVPEANRPPLQQLARWQTDRIEEDDVVKALRTPPVAEAMEEDPGHEILAAAEALRRRMGQAPIPNRRRPECPTVPHACTGPNGGGGHTGASLGFALAL